LGYKESYRVAEASELSAQAQISPARLEYAQELADLQEAFQQASNGERRLVFMRGEQSIGKSALLEAFLSKVQHLELAAHYNDVKNPTIPIIKCLGSLFHPIQRAKPKL
jgi:predicted ATPase